MSTPGNAGILPAKSRRDACVPGSIRVSDGRKMICPIFRSSETPLHAEPLFDRWFTC